MLNSSRIKFVYFEPDYLEDIMKARSSSEFYDSFFEYEPLNRKQQLSWWEQSFSKANEKNFILVTVNDSKFIGTISLVNIDFRNRKSELGRFYISSEHRNSGLGLESINLLIEYAFNHLNLNKVSLEVFSKNDNAKKLYLKSGFEYTGTLKQHIYKNGVYLDIDIFTIFKKAKSFNN